MHKKHNISLLTAVSLLCVGVVGDVRAEIYRCTDPVTGKATFSDRACPDRSQGESVEVGGPGKGADTITDTYTKRPNASANNNPGSTSGPGKYTHQARSAEKERADAASLDLERKVD
jgi:hypothetical protein